MMPSSLQILAALALHLLDGAEAFWRMNCAVIQVGRIDPVVTPNMVSGHVHTIVGASNIGVDSTYDTLVNSECTSCEIEADKSAYWTPLLYYSYPNGSVYEVPHSGSVVYYLARGPNANSTIPYPKGFQMLSGDKGARSYDNVTYTWGTKEYPGRPVADRVSFVCLPDGPSLPEYPYMFNTTCANGMRAQICFQSCWNGVDLYKSDNSHVAYLSGIDGGICPPTHPIQLPTLFLETLYAVAQVPDQSDDGRFVFSQGDPTGYGFHGDFQNGWDEDVLADATANCLVPDNFGQISYCPALYASWTNGYPVNCPERPAQIGESVHGMLDQLPGCNPITGGPELALPAAMMCPSNVPKPSITRTVNSTPRATSSAAYGERFGLDKHNYLGCFNDTAGGIRALNSISVNNYTAMTVEWCQNYCMERGYRLSGVEYTQECHCDNELNPTAVNGSNACSWHCGSTITGPRLVELTTPVEICGGLNYINIYNNTDASFIAFGDNSNTAGNAKPYTPPAGFGPNYLGCYSDGSSLGRALTGTSLVQNNMTIELCAEFCAQGGGYQYYGLEFATQCFCGDSIEHDSKLLTLETTPSNQTCQMRCRGEEPEICGGSNGLSLYNNTGFGPPKAKSPIGKYGSSQCVTDPHTNGRALQGSVMTDENMTNEMCVKYCLGKEYHYAGVEFATECYCGNSIIANSGAIQIECSKGNLMRCPGNVYEYCGGADLLNVYYSETL